MNKLIILTFLTTFLYLLRSTLCAEDCKKDDVEINFYETPYTSLLISIKWRAAYKNFRKNYGLTVAVDNQWYANRSGWFEVMNKDEINTIAFSAIDVEMTSIEREKFPKVKEIPVLAGALAMVYNLPNVTGLRLSIPIIADIFLRKITMWNDPQLIRLNLHTQLPEDKITVVVNGIDSSSETSIFSYIMSNYSASFNDKFGSLFDVWRKTEDLLVANGSQNLKYVSENKNSITYTSLTLIQLYVSLAKMKPPQIADIINSGGILKKFIPENITNDIRLAFKSNLADLYSDHLLSSNVYPFTYIHYYVMNLEHANRVSCCSMQEALGFAKYMLESSATITTLGDDGYISLPQNVVDFVETTVFKTLKCNKTNIYEEYSKYQPIVNSVTNTDTVVAVSLSLVVVLIVVALLFIYYHKRVKLAKETLWLISGHDFRKITENIQRSMRSRLSLNNGEKGSFSQQMGQQYILERIMWISKQLKTFAKPVEFVKENKHVSKWKNKTKIMLSIFSRDFTHPNVSMFYGITIQNATTYVIHQYCIKGTMNFVLKTCPYQMTMDIKYNLAINILSGLGYLHRKNIVLGNLNSITCYVDGMWNGKIVDWVDYSIALSECEDVAEVLQIENIPDDNTLIKLLYLDPDIELLKKATYECDIFAYGMLLIQIFTRKLPFEEEVELSQASYSEILRNKFINKIVTIPEMTTTDVPTDIQLLAKKMMGPYASRPNVDTIVMMMEKLWGIGKDKTIVDLMMEAMDDYVADLEEKVMERTGELTTMTNRMKDILNELLPPQIATKFISGESIEPEFFECASICFSDIVGFTTISARSTPSQVMHFLNELWKLFDRTLEKFDVYKVDTIGDAYMVASGLPTRNGISHCQHIADLALTLIEEAKTFTIPHLNDEVVKIRMGINSGPVTAGIVGFKMPQYCIFGDTVNTASRMESTSVPYKIQISEFSYTLMQSYFLSQYEFELRGETQVKVRTMHRRYIMSESGGHLSGHKFHFGEVCVKEALCNFPLLDNFMEFQHTIFRGQNKLNRLL